MKQIVTILLSVVIVFSMIACGQNNAIDEPQISENTGAKEDNNRSTGDIETDTLKNFVLVKGGTFQMGSPEDEAWRSDDETQHTVTVSDFYMSRYELTQEEYEAVIGENPSNFSGASLPVEMVSWLDAVAYCNARSEKEGLDRV